MQLYKWLYPSVGPLICGSVLIKLKSGKTSVLDTFCGRHCLPIRDDIVTLRLLLVLGFKR